jgi:hypothetical protein
MRRAWPVNRDSGTVARPFGTAQALPPFAALQALHEGNDSALETMDAEQTANACKNRQVTASAREFL